MRCYKTPKKCVGAGAFPPLPPPPPLRCCATCAPLRGARAGLRPTRSPTAISTKTADFVYLCRCPPPGSPVVDGKARASAAVHTPKPPTRPAGKSNCLGNPLGQAGERLRPSGTLFARARCSFWLLAIFWLIFCMPGGARVTTGSIFEILTS
jgi:hypothetical protein